VKTLLVSPQRRKDAKRFVGTECPLTSGEAEMYPVWDLEEHEPPKRVIEVPLASLQLQTFYFHERFLRRVTR
jgi:hypothetical protein